MVACSSAGAVVDPGRASSSAPKAWRWTRRPAASTSPTPATPASSAWPPTAPPRPSGKCPETVLRLGRELARAGGAHDVVFCGLIRVGGACGPPPPVAAALASSLRAPFRGELASAAATGGGGPQA